MKTGGRVVFLSTLALAFGAGATSLHSQVLRSRVLETRPRVLRSADTPGDVIPLRLFSDSSYEAVLEKFVDDPGHGLVWRGRLLDHPGSWVVMVEQGAVMAGVISTGDRVFRIRFAGYGLHAIEEMDPRSLQWFADDTAAASPAVEPFASGSEVDVAQPAEAGDTEIDVLMVYTGKAGRVLVNDPDRYWFVDETDARRAIESQAMLSIAVANAALDNSRTRATLRLVGVKKIQGRGSKDSGLDLDRLAHPSDGVWDNVHDLRNRYGADFVVLIIARMEEDVGGRGYVVPASSPFAADFAFSIVRSSLL